MSCMPYDINSQNILSETNSKYSDNCHSWYIKLLNNSNLYFTSEKGLWSISLCLYNDFRQYYYANFSYCLFLRFFKKKD